MVCKDCDLVPDGKLILCFVMLSRGMKTRFRWNCAQTVSAYPYFWLPYPHQCVGLICLVFLLLVDADEIRRLGKRFRKLDLDNSGALSLDEFLSLPELQQNPLVQRVIDIFDEDGNGEVDFKGIGYVRMDSGITVCV